MNNRLFLLAAIGLGLFAALLNWVYLSQAQAAGVTVLRVKDDQFLSAGNLVNPTQLEEVTIFGDVGQLQRLVVTKNDFSNFSKVPLSEPLGPGDLLLLSSFNVRGDEGIRQALVPGERAISLRVTDEAKAAAYFVRPGDVVDLWGSFAGQALVIKKRARVAAVGETYRIAEEGRAGDRTFRTITIIVPEADVMPLLTNIDLAGNQVTLSLVGPEDAKLQPEPALAALPSTAASAAAAAARNQRPSRNMVMPATPPAAGQSAAPAGQPR